MFETLLSRASTDGCIGSIASRVSCKPDRELNGFDPVRCWTQEHSLFYATA